LRANAQIPRIHGHKCLAGIQLGVVLWVFGVVRMQWGKFYYFFS